MPADRLAAARCLLFVPGDRPERFAKALAASPDGIIIDLEDAVAEAAKPAARREAAAFLAGRTAGTPPVVVRLNALGTRAALDDLAALADGALAPDAVMLAKTETPRDVELVRAHDPGGRPLVALIESIGGLEQAAAIARTPGCAALAFGGVDLAGELGAAVAWEPLLAARSRLVRAAASGRLPCFDVPALDFGDPDAVAAESARVRALGFMGKLAIHPAQVAPIRAAFAPSAAEIAQARRVIAADAAAAGAAVSLDGRMVDRPVVVAARRLLARAGA